MLVDNLTRAMLESFNSFRLRLGPHLYSPMCSAPLNLGIKNVRHECECEFQTLVDVKLGKEDLHIKYKSASLSFKFQKLPVSSLLDIREKVNTKLLKICPCIPCKGRVPIIKMEI